jgi:outer membrane protein OmpA-like peptidoglycan-associated protein
MTDDGDDGARVGLWVALGVITLLLFGVIGGLVFRQAHKNKAQPVKVVAAPAAAPVAAALVVPDSVMTAAPAVAAADALLDAPISGTLASKLYFEVGAAALPANAAAAIDAAKAALGQGVGSSKLVLSGFHDASGDPVKNAELAKQRAKAVRDALTAAGIDANRIALRKPEVTTGGGPANEARRVEIRLVP